MLFLESYISLQISIVDVLESVEDKKNNTLSKSDVCVLKDLVAKHATWLRLTLLRYRGTKSKLLNLTILNTNPIPS